MKQVIKKSIFQILVKTNGFPLKQLLGTKLHILMFHRVVNTVQKNRISNDGIEVSQEYLTSLIKFYLQNKFTPLSIEKLPQINLKKTNKRYVVFTFDDGYLDNLTLALPIFKKNNIPFTVSVTTNYILKKDFAWWYFLEDLLLKHDNIQFDEESAPIIASNTNEKEYAFNTLRASVQKNKSIIDYLVQKYGLDKKKYESMFLNEEQLVTLSKEPLVTIGAHTISHPSLAKLSESDSYHEIIHSKNIIENIIQKEINHFAYPFGTENDFSSREEKLVRQAGYKSAVTTCYGGYKDDLTNDILKLKRIWTSETNTSTELIRTICTA